MCPVDLTLLLCLKRPLALPQVLPQPRQSFSHDQQNSFPFLSWAELGQLGLPLPDPELIQVLILVPPFAPFPLFRPLRCDTNTQVRLVLVHRSRGGTGPSEGWDPRQPPLPSPSSRSVSDECLRRGAEGPGRCLLFPSPCPLIHPLPGTGGCSGPVGWGCGFGAVLRRIPAAGMRTHLTKRGIKLGGFA